MTCEAGAPHSRKAHPLRPATRKANARGSLYIHAVLLVLRRLATAVPVVFGVSVLTFWIVNSLPGNAATSLLGTDATAAQVAALEVEFGLNRPPVERYVQWLRGLLAADLGQSLASGQPVATMLAGRVSVTAELVLLAIVTSALCAVGMALLGARHPGGLADRIVDVVSVLAISLPNYVVALMLVLVLAVEARVFPTIGFVPIDESFWGHIKSLTLPTIALALPFFGVCTRFLRGDLVDQMTGHGYVNTAKAKGLGAWSVLVRHALRNSLLGLITVVGLNIAPMLGGTVVIEQIFALPGLGRLLLQSVNARDVVMTQGIVLVIAVVTVLSTAFVDLLYFAVDPRIRFGN